MKIYRHTIKLKDRFLQFFVNEESGLVCVDVIDKDETGGQEVLRTNAYNVNLSFLKWED